MKRRILSLLLAVLMLLPALVSCSEKSADPQSSDPAPEQTTAAPAAAEEEDESQLSSLELRQRIPDNLPANNFNGRDFTVCTEERKFYEIFSEELTGEATNDAVYDRNIRIEDRFNVKIGTLANGNPENQVITTVTSGTHDFDIVGFVNYKTYTPVTSGVLYNWLDIPLVDLSQPWHNQLANGDATVNGKLFGMTPTCRSRPCSTPTACSSTTRSWSSTATARKTFTTSCSRASGRSKS